MNFGFTDIISVRSIYNEQIVVDLIINIRLKISKTLAFHLYNNNKQKRVEEKRREKAIRRLLCVVVLISRRRILVRVHRWFDEKEFSRS